jgi:hypothetical protein
MVAVGVLFDVGGATRTAWALAMAATSQDASLAGFWFGSAAKSLAPYLLAGACTGVGMAGVARWIDAEERDEVPHHPAGGAARCRRAASGS